MPAAMAFDTPSRQSEGLLRKSKGSDPSPVDSAASHLRAAQVNQNVPSAADKSDGKSEALNNAKQISN